MTEERWYQYDRGLRDPDDRLNDWAAAREAGKSLRAIAQDAGVSRMTVKRTLDAAGVTVAGVKGRDGRTYTAFDLAPQTVTVEDVTVAGGEPDPFSNDADLSCDFAPLYPGFWTAEPPKVIVIEREPLEWGAQGWAADPEGFDERMAALGFKPTRRKVYER